MNIDDITIKQARELANMFAAPTPIKAATERPVIVRSRDAGCIYGYLLGYEGSTVHLRDARQMWSWTAAEGGTLLDCATYGVRAGKFSTPARHVIVIGACAIIDVSAKALPSLESAKWA
jgi:hypothetical protein